MNTYARKRVLTLMAAVVRVYAKVGTNHVK